MKILTNDIALDLDNLTIEDSSGVLKLAPQKHSPAQGRAYLKITNSCNAQCKYCFQGTHYYTDTINISQYSVFLRKVLQKNRDVVIFGGEPLLKQNLRSIDFLFSLNRKKKFVFFSNGYFDDSIRGFLNQNIKQVETIVISLDGLERTHNQRRPFGKRNGFTRIVSNISYLLEKKIPFTIQINIDMDNYHEVIELVWFLFDRFNQDCRILLNRVLHSENELTIEELLRLFVKIKRLTNYKKLFVNSVVVDKISDLLTERGISCSRCNICNTKVYDFAHNLVYCCPQISQSVIGTFSFKEEAISSKELISYVKHSNKDNSECLKCKLRNFCEFGCLDDNNKHRAECQNYTIAAIRVILENLDVFLDFLTLDDDTK